MTGAVFKAISIPVVTGTTEDCKSEVGSHLLSFEGLRMSENERDEYRFSR